MKQYLVAFAFLCLLTTCQSNNDKPVADESEGIIRLPITLKQGYGPFHPGFGILGAEHLDDPLLGKIYLPVEGLPKRWSGLTRSMVWLNAAQLIYQNFKAGTITPENYQYFQQQRQWPLDTTELSSKPIKCYLYVLRGFDENRGRWAVMADTDNDLDFSDETAVYPDVIKSGTIPEQIESATTIRYEIYRKGKVLTAHVPMVFKIMGDQFLYNFPQYAEATFKRNNQEHKLLILPGSGFSRLDFESISITPLSSILSSGKVDPQKLTEIGETIELSGITYTNKGIDLYNNWLELEPIGHTTKEYSLQRGHHFAPFAAKEFSTGKVISSNNLKGKYVYVDFWGTWCKGCVEEMPALKKLYEGLDKTRFEFIGIACGDSPASLKRFIDKKQIAWPQILSDEKNKLVELYHVTGFPTSVLIDPQGVVIAKNIHGEALSGTLKKLGN